MTEFDLARRTVQQDQVGREQARRDALKRRFAQAGQLGSGSMIKQEQIGLDQAAQDREGSFNQIGIAEAQQKRADADKDVERQFRDKQLGQQNQQFEKQFGLQQQAQTFGQDMAGKQFGLQESGQKFSEGFQNRQFKESLNQFNKQFDLQGQQFDLAKQQAIQENTANAYNFLTSLGAGQDTLLDFIALSNRMGRPATIDEIDTLQRQRKEDESMGRRRMGR